MSLFRYLWAPWRKDYIDKKESGCFICRTSGESNDEENFVLFRGEKIFAILNLYPYNTGHLLIAPFRHVGDLRRMTDAEGLEMWHAAQKLIEVMEKEMRVEGFNIGFNLGKVSGAGVESHVHMHLVPRWLGDTNFLPVVGGVKVISEELKSVYSRLRRYFING